MVAWSRARSGPFVGRGPRGSIRSCWRFPGTSCGRRTARLDNHREIEAIRRSLEQEARCWLHLSEGDLDGEIPAMPLQAVLAARAAQRQFPGKVVHVRATDNDKAKATELFGLLGRYKGAPPSGVDVEGWRARLAQGRPAHPKLSSRSGRTGKALDNRRSTMSTDSCEPHTSRRYPRH